MNGIRKGASGLPRTHADSVHDGVTEFARVVLDAVASIPPGKVMTYGDIAEFVGRGSARTVGMVMAAHGSEVPWQRVVQASGRPAEPLVAEAVRLLRAEGCPLRGDRVVMADARWDGRQVSP